MEELKKRERKRNFSVDESQLLADEFKSHKDVLESKLTNTVTKPCDNPRHLRFINAYYITNNLLE